VTKEKDAVIYARFTGSCLMGSHLQWYLHADDDSFASRLAILQRDALLKIILSGDPIRSSEPALAGARSSRGKKG
jgi:hypothetical protein